jgi:hypothetical protein
MICPTCGTPAAYVGFTTVECRNAGCQHYKPDELTFGGTPIVFDNTLPSGFYPAVTCNTIPQVAPLPAPPTQSNGPTVAPPAPTPTGRPPCKLLRDAFHAGVELWCASGSKKLPDIPFFYGKMEGGKFYWTDTKSGSHGDPQCFDTTPMSTAPNTTTPGWVRITSEDQIP